MENKTFMTFKIEDEDDDDERTVTGISAVTGVIDSGFDLIHRGAFKKTIVERFDRVKHLWQHDMRMPPIASIVKMEEITRGALPKKVKDKYPDAKGGLLVKRRYLETARGDEILAGIKSDPPAINEMSFGYDAVKYDFEELKEGDYKGYMVRNLREIRLWDTSDVIWGMNQATVANVKLALQFKDTGTVADKEEKWSPPVLSDFTDEEEFENLSTFEKQRIASHFALIAQDPPKKFDDLLLPHHVPAKEGVGPAIWKGVSAAMDDLVQVSEKMPADSQQPNYHHLSKHFEQFEEEAPQIKYLQLLWTVKDAMSWFDPDVENELKEGFYLPDQVSKTLVELDSLLRAEPPSEEFLRQVLTQQKLSNEFEIRKRTLSLSH